MSGLIRLQIMKKIELKYFTGTGNSLHVLNMMKNEFQKNNYDIDLTSITVDKDLNYDCELAGFCFPVYAYGLPRICLAYLNSLAVQKSSNKVFLIVTAGNPDEIGYALEDGKEILQKKNIEVVYSDAIQMPSNWIPFMETPPKSQAQSVIEKGTKKAIKIANNLMNGTSYHHEFHIPKSMSRRGFLFEYHSFHKLGIYYMWRMFRTYENCNSCGSCVKVCPTNSIALKESKPRWKSSCEQCMRCVNYCKQKAIYQIFGGQTNGKDRYLEPHFKPLRN